MANKEKQPVLFEFLKSINFSKIDVMDAMNEKEYQPFVINRFLCAADTIFYLHDMNIRPQLDARLQYDYLRHTIRAAKRFRKFPKGISKMETTEIIKKYYGYSNEKAISVLSLLNSDDLKRMEMGMREGGLMKNRSNKQ